MAGRRCVPRVADLRRGCVTGAASGAPPRGTGSAVRRRAPSGGRVEWVRRSRSPLWRARSELRWTSCPTTRWRTDATGTPWQSTGSRRRAAVGRTRTDLGRVARTDDEIPLLSDDLDGKDVVELGCGTAYVSAWSNDKQASPLRPHAPYRMPEVAARYSLRQGQRYASDEHGPRRDATRL